MRVAITGGIGSGKSFALEYLKKRGFAVYDADAISREVAEQKEVIEEVAAAFGADCVSPEGSLDRKLLAERAFESAEGTKKLNAIMHPRILNRMWALDEQSGLVFIEVPLLFETGAESGFDRIWLITANTETRIARVQARNGLTRSEILKRMAAQLPESEKAARSDEVLSNDGAPEALFEKIEKILKGEGYKL